MENDNTITTKKEKGCLLTGALWLSLLGAFFNAFFSGAFVIANTPQRLNEVEYWVFIVSFIVSVYAIYCTFVTFKMKKRGAYGLLVAMALTVVLLVGALAEKPVDDSAKAGAGWMLIMAVGCLICAIIVALHLKKME